MPSAYDINNQYNAWKALQHTDAEWQQEAANQGDRWAGDPNAYMSMLTQQYRDQYGDPTKEFDWSKYGGTPADQLLYLGGGEADREGNGVTDNHFGAAEQGYAQLALHQAKAYDPNAHLNDLNQLIYDRKKLPEWKGPTYEQSKKFGGLVNLEQQGGEDRLINKDFVLRDKNYGNLTPKANLEIAQGDKDTGFMGQLSKYMPVVISSLMAAGLGAAAGPLIGSLLSGTIGPNGIASKLSMGEGFKGAMSNWPGMLANMVPYGGAAYSVYNMTKRKKKI